jgi:intermediate peptidase
MLRRFAAGRNHVLPLNTCLEPSCSTYRSYATTSGSIVKEAFDAPLTPYKSNTGRTGTGRFRYDALQRPKDFLTLSRKTTARAQAIVSRLLAYTPCPSTSCQESKERDLLVQVKQIDRLSDLLCSVIDLAEVVRNLDPDPQWIEYADKAYSELCLLMNQLNTHVELYQVSFTRPIGAKLLNLGRH